MTGAVKLKTVSSVCPECKKVINADLVEENGAILIKKECSDHGKFEDMVFSDSKFYYRLSKWDCEYGEGVHNPLTEVAHGCPSDCGICGNHKSTPAMTIIDLTNTCNLNCPYCFAKANENGNNCEPDLALLRKMIDTTASLEPKRRQAIQFSGGEPSIAPLFMDALRLAKEYEWQRIMIATNGVKFGQSIDFTLEAAEAGLRGVYLQFDSTEKDVWLKTRSANLYDIKMQAMENFRKAGIDVTLVPTIVKNVNSQFIGDIINFAIKNVDVVSSISFQPVAITGRIDYEKRMEMRFTLSDLAREIHEQTGYAHPIDHWFPANAAAPISGFFDKYNKRELKNVMCTCHHLCGIATYMLVNTENNSAVAIPKFLDMDSLFPLFESLAKGNGSKIGDGAKLFNQVRKAYNKKEAPQGFGLLEFMKVADALTGKRLTGMSDKHRYKWRLMLVSGMHFMDSYNFISERVRNCVIQYVGTDCKMYPFCTYNSGPEYRHKVEAEFLKNK